MTILQIAGIGLCASGLPNWETARRALAGEAPFAPTPLPRFACAALPGTERRRANETTRWAIEVASGAVSTLAPADLVALPSVFASADGDGAVLASILAELVKFKVALSPTTFHNSVFNAPAGYWSIAARAVAASSTVCAGDASFAAGFVEAAMQASATRQSILYVAYDLPFPQELPVEGSSNAPFACAFVLRPHGARADGHGSIERWSVTDGPVEADDCPASIRSCFAGNAAAAALPLLAAIARTKASRVTLPYLDASHVELRYAPCK